jgi:ubiquinone/menaquinone biosynthesis C-methylase UbiE
MTVRSTARIVTRSCLFLLVWLALGCQTSRRPQVQAAPKVASQSVKPGINAEYLKPDLQASAWVERFEREGREIYDLRERIVASARPRRGAAVADIGAGTGLFVPLLSEAVGAGGKVYAVDIVPAFLDHIRRRSQESGLRNVTTVLGTERSVELPEHAIDLAFVCDVYHHFEYPQDSLASIRRALRPGGQLFLVEFKRIPGQSPDWILNHVRAGEEVVTAEIEAAGFRRVERFDFLQDNYVLRFRKI